MNLGDHIKMMITSTTSRDLSFLANVITTNAHMGKGEKTQKSPCIDPPGSSSNIDPIRWPAIYYYLTANGRKNFFLSFGTSPSKLSIRRPPLACNKKFHSRMEGLSEDNPLGLPKWLSNLLSSS
ncbi:hypothetical protein CEXT_594551 [Caerostris extrusa]|uniref:Uncharacterized protein n=1 Tax=Caerostris extrusa TaxID=172846 RepID=A0AAV4QPZ5_CAEEX|nr:hypothetical protein CEXT_594551 [Caerostris extrusa]